MRKTASSGREFLFRSPILAAHPLLESGAFGWQDSSTAGIFVLGPCSYPETELVVKHPRVSVRGLSCHPVQLSPRHPVSLQGELRGACRIQRARRLAPMLVFPALRLVAPLRFPPHLQSACSFLLLSSQGSLSSLCRLGSQQHSHFSFSPESLHCQFMNQSLGHIFSLS